MSYIAEMFVPSIGHWFPVGSPVLSPKVAVRYLGPVLATLPEFTIYRVRSSVFSTLSHWVGVEMSASDGTRYRVRNVQN